MEQPISSPPQNLIPWLTHRASMTEKLLTKTGDAKLQVLNQQWQDPSAWDINTLKLSSAQTPIMRREILISSNQEPCWYARTILPQSTYTAHETLFIRLKKEPLGKLIFAENSNIKRTFMTYYAINQKSIEYTWLPDTLEQYQQELWLRSSIFTLPRSIENNHHDKFCLIEILLPGLLRVDL